MLNTTFRRMASEVHISQEKCEFIYATGLLVTYQ
jgi:hypothetical protein